jgi:hypothetical protein
MGYVRLEIAGGADDSCVVACIYINGGTSFGLCDGKATGPRYCFHVASLAERQGGGWQEE